MTQRLFAGIIHRAEAWDHSKPAPEQDGFAAHANYVAGLESSGFLVQAGLMQPSDDVLMIYRADSEDAVRRRVAEDPWQQDGHARLVRLEEITFRLGAPGG